jgi:hypothetical protein
MLKTVAAKLVKVLSKMRNPMTSATIARKMQSAVLVFLAMTFQKGFAGRTASLPARCSKKVFG